MSFSIILFLSYKVKFDKVSFIISYMILYSHSSEHTDVNVALPMIQNCSQHYNIEDSWYARGAAGITCLLITSIFLCELLCDHRAYKTTLQRLVLYYTVLSFIYHILNSVNGMVQEYSPPSPGNPTALENAAMYFADAAFILPAIIINYLISLILRLCCGFHVRHPRFTKSSNFITELVCFVIGVVFSLIWLPANTAIEFKHFSFDMFYTVFYASGCQANDIFGVKPVIAAVALSAIIIGEMVVAVIVLNVAHRRVRLQISGQQVLALERKTHVIVIAVAVFYVVGIAISFPLCLLEVYDYEDIDWNASEIFLAIWFPILNQCNLFILYVASIRTTDHPLFCNCLQRKKPRVSDHTDKKHLTNPSSHPFSQPTHTTWHPPYTNGFTEITQTKFNGVHSDDSSGSASTEEMVPLLKAGKFESHTYSAQTDCGV